MLNGLCGINGATVRLGGGPSNPPAALTPGSGVQVTLFMSPNGDTSHRPSPLCAGHLQTMHQNIKSIHPHYIPVLPDERYREKVKEPSAPHRRYTPLLLPGAMSNAVQTFLLHEMAKYATENADN